MERVGAIVLCGLVVMMFHGCRGQSEEDAVAAVFADMAARVESRDTDGLIAHLDEGYRDHEGRDLAATREMAGEYFRRYRGIKAKLLSWRVTLGESGSAAAEIDVSLYSGVASALRKAVGFDGENYRVSCRLRKSDRWLLSEASWEYIPVSGLFPESLQVLRELFPDA
jgi:hypothetical protein